MSNFANELDKIKCLMLSTAKWDKSFAYSTLLHLQEQFSIDESLILPLVESTPLLLSSLIADMQDEDEEIAALALKCLGFMIYHPSIVSVIPSYSAEIVVELLARLITTTKIKSVCNLGVWCISIQQLDVSVLTAQFDSLLRAIVHSLDNPMGSLSTTYEAIQAVMKLGSQTREKMRETSSIWAPSVYRRLLSTDKRERDMCQRCLLKIKHLILPPTLNISKSIVQEIRPKLIPEMMELLRHSKKTQALQAWGWFIRLLGSYVLKKKHLVNEMLKIPEQTFCDQDPQIQIASQVAWEGLIDALIYFPSKVSATLISQKHKGQRDATVSKDSSEANSSGSPSDGCSKSLRLIMTPFIGIMTSECDVSVQSSCLNTWCYLLHKLDNSVNDACVLNAAVEPILNSVFSIGPEKGNICSWNFCINLLEDLIEAKSKNEFEADELANCNLSSKTCKNGTSSSEDCSWKPYSIKWLPWGFSQVDFFLRMIYMIINQATVASFSTENRMFACHAALKLFRSFLKELSTDLITSSTTNDEIMQSLHAFLMFSKKICEALLSVEDGNIDIQGTCLLFLEAITEELDPSTLCSPLYRIALDLKCVEIFQSAGEDRLKKLLGISSLCSMDMVKPMIYLAVLYFSSVIQLIPKTADIRLIQQKVCKYVKTSNEPKEVIRVIVSFLYGHADGSCSQAWIPITEAVRDCLADASEDSSPEMQHINTSGLGLGLCHLLIYPLFIHSSWRPLSNLNDRKSPTASPVFSQDLIVQRVVQEWKSLYCLVISIHIPDASRVNSFAENLCALLNGFLDECFMELNASDKIQEPNVFSLYGDVAQCITENLHIEKLNPEENNSDYKRSSNIVNCLEFIARLLKHSRKENEGLSSTSVDMVLRLLPPLAHLVSKLQLKDDILSFFEVLRAPLLPWLSNEGQNNDRINHHLQFLWAETLKSLQQSWPPIIFDSSFLELQAPSLEKTLNHPTPSISNTTITFWNSTYAKQPELVLPLCLHLVLDKLSQQGKITMVLHEQKASPESTKASSRCKAMAMPNVGSKRVKLFGKRRRIELTEHQKEVRRAQQGRERDSGGHGPGIRTYTSADFSQGNEDS